MEKPSNLKGPQIAFSRWIMFFKKFELLSPLPLPPAVLTYLHFRCFLLGFFSDPVPISVLRRRWRNVLRAHQPKESTFTVDIGLDLCSFLDDNCPSLGISFLHQINSLAWGVGGVFSHD